MDRSFRRGARGRTRGPVAAAAVGAAWGVAGYAVLWGHTPIFPSRSFVVGPLGTVLFAPVRVVLWGIHVVEARFASAPFDFSQNNVWIGILAAAVGGAMAWIAFVAVRATVRALGPYVPTSRRSNATEASTEKATPSPTSGSTSPGGGPSRNTSGGS